ncbi:MAG TPA: hypothetical protein VGA51_07920 [Casimicrobiaceae bacterium]
MTPEQVDRVFGHGRLKMVTGEHVEVFREAVGPGQRRRYTKRFLDTGDADFGQWTEREWRILARLIGHGIRCVPDVVQFDGGAMGGMRQVQTYDAGVTVDQWATLLPVSRNGVVHRHVFEDCAHWWALAHYCLAALNEIHSLQLVHLDIKGDNICIPFGPASFDPESPGLRLYPIFARLALIDFAFSLVSRESLATPLPIGWQKDYDYQSPRLLKALEAGRAGDLQPTKELDWRCDLYSLAAMLKRYLPDDDRAQSDGGETGWTAARYDDAKALIFRIRDRHDRDFPHWRPHQELLDLTGPRIRETDLAASLDYGWTLAREAAVDSAASPITPMTRIAPSIRVVDPARIVTRIVLPTAVTEIVAAPRKPAQRRSRRHPAALAAMLVAFAALAAPSFIGDPAHPLANRAREAFDAVRSTFDAAPSESAIAQSAPADTTAAQPPASELEPPSTREPAARAEEPAIGATTPSDEPRVAPDAPSHRSVPEQKATSPAVAQARPKAAVPTNRAQTPPRASQPRPLYPLPRSASNAAAPKQPRAHSIASTHSTSRPAPLTPLQAAPPSQPVQVAAASPTPPIEQPSVAIALPPTPTPRVEPSATAIDVRGAEAATPSIQPLAARSANAATEQSRASSTPAAPAGRAEPAPARVDNQRAQTTSPSRAPRTVPSAPPREERRSQLSALWNMLRGPDQRAAPIEERRALSAAPAIAAPRATELLAPATDALAQASPRPGDSPRAAPAPAPIEESRVPASPSWRPAPRASAPPALTIEARSSDRDVEDLAMQARRMLAESIPRVAAQAQSDVARVLLIAANASHPSQEAAVIDAVYATWSSEGVSIPSTSFAPVYARRVHDDARQMFATGRNVSDAVNLELRAFGANPRDPDVAASLAFLHLKMSPPQPEMARQLALHAIAVSGSRRTTRADDWTTLAVANALTGREAEARHALFVALALTRNIDRSCRAALGAYASFGERVRAPVEALLNRIHTQGRGYESPYCAWPPNWSAGSRWP